MRTNKIIIDPIYGFISIDCPLVQKVIDHPLVQRLRRIGQVGLTSLVFNGATHTRFQHSLGAMHLMQRAIDILRSKGVAISDDEREALLLAILLHDVGHGPYSHALEHELIPYDHEEVGLYLMSILNEEFEGALDLAICIFQDNYNRPFLHQLISSQLDMDRLDYLTRDSFYSGVVEGIVGYNRLLEMIHVIDDRLVVEERGIYTLEKFIISRRHMYLQVYLHPTALSMERMIIEYIRLLKEQLIYSRSPSTPLEQTLLEEKKKEGILQFIQLDDTDVIGNLKYSTSNRLSAGLEQLASALVNRIPNQIIVANSAEECDIILEHRINSEKLRESDVKELMSRTLRGSYQFQSYGMDNEINILTKSGGIVPFSAKVNGVLNFNSITKHYLCYPKF